MKARFIPMIVLAAALAAAACPAARAEDGPARISLRDKAILTRDVIRLADVAELGEGVPAGAAGLSLGNAPWPGNCREVSRALIKVRLVSAGFDLSRFSFCGSDVCVAELDTVRVEPDAIVAAARECLESFFPEGGPDVQIELLREVQPVELPAAGGPPELRAAVSGSGVPLGSSRVDVSVIRDGARLKRVPVGFSVRLSRRVAVAADRIASGQRLGPADFTLATRDVTSLGDGCFSAPEELAGKVASRTIQPGEVITRRMVDDAQSPLVIKANQRVFLLVQTETLRVVTLGRAVAPARKGEMARAKNLTTGRDVVGIAVDDKTIQVPLGGAPHAN